MNSIEKKDHNSIDKNKDIKISKWIEEKKIINDEHNKISDLAEKIILQPIKKWLESLKQLILPEKTKKEVKEKLSVLNKEKQQENEKIIIWSKKTLTELKQIVTPAYYIDHAKKWSVEMAQTEAVSTLIQKVSDWKNDSNIIARWVSKILDQIKRYT